MKWEDRYLVTDSQRVRDPIKWRKSAVMSQRWRLVNGVELYDIQADPGQKNDIASAHPKQVEQMRAFYDEWWAELLPTFSQTTEIHLGHADHPKVTMTGHDWIQKSGPPWNQAHIRNGQTKKQIKHNGHWAVKVLSNGEYRIALRRWPEEANHPIIASLPAGENVPGASQAFRARPGNAVLASKATLRINGNDIATKDVNHNDVEVAFIQRLEKGSHQLAPYFTTSQGELGAYYCIVTKMN